MLAFAAEILSPLCCFCAPRSLGGDGAGFLLRDFFFGAEPIFEVLAVSSAPCLVQFVCALTDSFFNFLRIAHGCRRWLLVWISGHGGISLFGKVTPGERTGSIA